MFTLSELAIGKFKDCCAVLVIRITTYPTGLVRC